MNQIARQNANQISEALTTLLNEDAKLDRARRDIVTAAERGRPIGAEWLARATMRRDLAADRLRAELVKLPALSGIQGGDVDFLPDMVRFGSLLGKALAHAAEWHDECTTYYVNVEVDGPDLVVMPEAQWNTSNGRTLDSFSVRTQYFTYAWEQKCDLYVEYLRYFAECYGGVPESLRMERRCRRCERMTLNRRNGHVQCDSCED